jgi:hypothetical protein
MDYGIAHESNSSMKERFLSQGEDHIKLCINKGAL